MGVNHVVLFMYILLIAGGTGGVVALSLLHFRLRTPVTSAFLVANIGLLLSLLVYLVSFYIDTVVVPTESALVARLRVFRTIAGYLVGLTVYGSLTTAVYRLPKANRRAAVALGTAVITAMTIQSGLILSGAIEIAIALGPYYIVFVSVCIFGFGLTMVKAGRSALTPTMMWMILRLGYLMIGFSIVSTIVYAVLMAVPLLDSFSISLDFVFYAAWSWISIGAFIRYISRPSLTGESETISTAFIDTFGITKREQDIIRLIARGRSNQEIADDLGISFGTVRTHVYNIFQKAGAGSRVDLLRLVSGYRE